MFLWTRNFTERALSRKLLKIVDFQSKCFVHAVPVYRSICCLNLLLPYGYYCVLLLCLFGKTCGSKTLWLWFLQLWDLSAVKESTNGAESLEISSISNSRCEKPSISKLLIRNTLYFYRNRRFLIWNTKYFILMSAVPACIRSSVLQKVKSEIMIQD